MAIGLSQNRVNIIKKKNFRVFFWFADRFR